MAIVQYWYVENSKIYLCARDVVAATSYLIAEILISLMSKIPRSQAANMGNIKNHNIFLYYLYIFREDKLFLSPFLNPTS